MFAVVPLWFALVHKNALTFARLRVPLQGARCLVVSLVLCLCLAFTVSLPCLCRVSVVSCLVLAVSWPWCRAVALVLPCRCPAFAMHLPCLFRVLPCRGRGLLCLCRVFAVALPCLCCCLPCVCRGIAVFLPWFCCVFAVSWPCVIAVRLPVPRVCCKFAMHCAVFFCGCTPAPPPESGNPGKSGFESPSDQPASLPKPIPATCCDELVHVACPAIWQGATNVCEERLSRHKRITSLAGPACVAPSSYCRHTKHR